MQDEVTVKKINISFERVEEFKYLVTALLTYLLHGAESFLRS